MSDSSHPTTGDTMTGPRAQHQMPLLRQGFHREFHRKTFSEIEEVIRQAMGSTRLSNSPRKPSSLRDLP